ncbi:MAG: hypothetical protein HC838_01165 [Spirulinaceae cyanobacterium RM2_2_10]|nr:hypothetical protein [Spirulinaceae cyanobacterium SM2_1_0]NJO18942.1 hypothetical protein [Spirulinaceae cyanobacterium RM2_2_10]
MKSDMDRNAETLYRQLLDWLQCESVTSTPPTAAWERTADDLPDTEFADWGAAQCDPLDGEEAAIDEAAWNLDDSTPPLPPSSDMGEFAIVQKRFQALLKRRLYTETERRPPLFPWETELSEYALDYAESERPIALASRQVWLPQLASAIATSLPEAQLMALLDACTESVDSLKPKAAKMVSAVTDFFPDCAQRLNDMAARLRLSPSFAPSRLAREEQQQQQQRLAALLPRDYATATPDQQMAISLLVAKEILDQLTLDLMPQQPVVEKLWQTATGTVRLRADYQPQTRQVGGDLFSQQPLRVRVQMPSGGRLILQANQESITAQRTYAGYLSVELSDWQPGQVYLLEVHLQGNAQKPLRFGLSCGH